MSFLLTWLNFVQSVNLLTTPYSAPHSEKLNFYQRGSIHIYLFHKDIYQSFVKALHSMGVYVAAKYQSELYAENISILAERSKKNSLFPFEDSHCQLFPSKAFDIGLIIATCCKK